MLAHGEILFGKYRVEKLLGKGGFSEVYQARSLSEGEKIAIKIEKSNGSSPLTLPHESQILSKLCQLPCIPRVFFLQTSPKRAILGLKLLGNDLKSLRQSGLFEVSERNFAILAWESLKIIERIHDRGVIHLDIKPDNILLSKEKRGQIHLIDFGIAVDTGNDRGELPTGSVLFASVARMEKKPVSHRDDLESWLYTLAFMVKAQLPWEVCVNFEGKKGGKAAILKMKKTISAQKLCEGLPVEMVEIAEYIRSLSGRNKPNYANITDLLQKSAHRLGVNPEKATISVLQHPPVSIARRKSLNSRNSPQVSSDYHRSTSHHEHIKANSTVSDEVATPKGKSTEFLPTITESLRVRLVTSRLRRMSAIV